MGEGDVPIRRDVGAWLDATILQPSSIVLAIAVSSVYDVHHETLVAELDGRDLSLAELDGGLGSRLHVTEPLAPGHLSVRYEASIGTMVRPVDADPDRLTRIVHCRPSRYCESDRLAPVATSEFNGLRGHDLVDAVRTWVGSHLGYVSGSSRHTDGAVATYLAREGVCRDFAHLVIALLRACDVPARMVSVYAPGLEPMDFHAVAEAWIDGAWFAVDATGLAPRTAMVRVATGRDAADTAFMTAQGGSVQLDWIEVGAVAQPELPAAIEGPVELG